MRLTYHPEVELELIEAARFYEGRVAALGTEFLDMADDSIRLIQSTPERFRMVENGVRLFIMNRFPYSIYYRLLPDEIRILAFKHQSRHPDYWQERLSE